MSITASSLRLLLQRLSRYGVINPYAVALILTERAFRGPFFRMGEFLYCLFSILIFRTEPKLTVGHCQVSFVYWRAYYGKSTTSLLLGTFSFTESCKICCLYLDANKRNTIREMLVCYNGRPSNLYVSRFTENLKSVRDSLTISGLRSYDPIAQYNKDILQVIGYATCTPTSK